MDVTKKKRQCGGSGASSSNATIKDKIHAIRQDMQCFHQIDKRMKIPTSLYRALSDTFKCKICQRAPIFARCCKSVLGCQGCVDTWYKGEDGISKKCPLCGTDRALPESMRLHGLDDFLIAIQPLLCEPQEIGIGDDITQSD